MQATTESVAPHFTVGILSQNAEAPLCNACGRSFDLPNAEWSKFSQALPWCCDRCGTWFHADCLERTKPKSANCPACHRESSVVRTAPYCVTCLYPLSGFPYNSKWPESRCAKCKQPLALAVTRSVLGRELAYLGGIALSLVPLLVWVEAADRTPFIKWLVITLSVLFTAPWLLIIIGLCIQSTLLRGEDFLGVIIE